jgi:hypothetical protein
MRAPSGDKLRPSRRRRDDWLHYATIIALVLQIVVAAFPDVCRNVSLNQLIERLRDN